MFINLRKEVTSFDIGKSFQINVVYRIQIQKESNSTTMLRTKYEKMFLRPPE